MKKKILFTLLGFLSATIVLLLILFYRDQRCLDRIRNTYSAESINLLYQSAYHLDRDGVINHLNKHKKDIYISLHGHLWEQDSSIVVEAIKEINDVGLPIKLYLNQDSLKSNLKIYFEKDTFPKNYFGLGLVKIDSVSVIFMSNSYNNTDKLRLRRSIMLGELVNFLGAVGDTWAYRNCHLYQGVCNIPYLTELDKEVLRLLYENCITRNLRKVFYEEDFQDILYNMNAPQKIADYFKENNISIDYLNEIKLSCRDSSLIKWGDHVFINLTGDYNHKDSIFCDSLLKEINLISPHINVSFVDKNSPVYPPIININYEQNESEVEFSRIIMSKRAMMFPFIGDASANILFTPETEQSLKNKVLTDLIFSSLTFNTCTDTDHHKEIISLLYKPIFYSGMPISELDKAIEILKKNE